MPFGPYQNVVVCDVAASSTADTALPVLAAVDA